MQKSTTKLKCSATEGTTSQSLTIGKGFGFLICSKTCLTERGEEEINKDYLNLTSQWTFNSLSHSWAEQFLLIFIRLILFGN